MRIIDKFFIILSLFFFVIVCEKKVSHQIKAKEKEKEAKIIEKGKSKEFEEKS